MKLLTWMHRKFRQGSSETLKEFSSGQQFFDDHHIYQKENHGNGRLKQGHRDGRQSRKSFANLETTRMEYIERRTSTESESESEFFEGFLAIGTFGTEKVMTEAETPTFAVSFERLAEGETEVTENELRLINDELERVLAAEAKDEYDSSSRNSHVSNGRISHASTITLGEKPLDIISAESLICPLQEYLLGSAVEMQLTEKTLIAPKKENRTSLGELFEKHKEDVFSETKFGRKQDKELGEKSSKNIVKKILNKRTVHASPRSLSAAESPSHETKLSKILHKFHKKVHPECSASMKKTQKNSSVGYTLPVPVPVPVPDERGRHNKSYSNSAHFIGDGSDSSGSRECWIKTDADYLVLEL